MTSLNGTVNGTKTAVPPWDGWRPITLPTVQVEPVPQAEPATSAVPAEPAVDHVALAEAEAIRRRAEAEAEALRIEAEGKAEAERIRAVEEARKQKIANDKAEGKALEEAAAREARIAESRRLQAEADRAREEAVRAATEQQQAETEQAAKVAASATSWRRAALGFAIVCAVVALPVQMSAFYSRNAPWLLAAPLVLEGGAWVVLKGAAAAVDEHRPHWHYRLIAWTLAALAAGINLSHGLAHFGRATAMGTAFASLAGPGVWDLHEHGRIRTRDGKLARREAKARKAAEKRAAAEKADERKRIEKEKAEAAAAAQRAAEELAQRRERLFPKVWEHAEKLAADLGQTTVTQAVWERAKLDVEGARPGESAEVLRMRNAAVARVDAARQNKPVNTVSKTSTAQRASQMPPRVYKPPVRPGRRTKGDTPRYVNAARTQAAITAKNAARNTPRED